MRARPAGAASVVNAFEFHPDRDALQKAAQ
jgi:hypothetical protein